MSTALVPPPPQQFPNRKRWTRQDCELLERVGLLPARYELIDGQIIDKVGQNRPHAIAVTLLIKWLVATFGGEYVQCQLPIEVADADRPTYRPEPDASVLVESVTAYPDAPPGPGDLRLVIEVADTTLYDDLTTKATLYARAGVPEYWVLDVPGRRLVVHRIPMASTYQEIHTLTADQSVAVIAAPDFSVHAADLLPPASAGEAA